MIWAQKQRMQILDSIKNIFIEADKKELGIDKEKLIIDISINFGSTRRKAIEYITTLKNFGFIVEDEFGLWLHEKYIDKEKQKIIKEANIIFKNKPEIY